MGEGPVDGRSEPLSGARLLVAPEVTDAVVRGLAERTGRTVQRFDAARFDAAQTDAARSGPTEPVVYVGAELPAELRASGRLRWFHSVNAGVDRLLDSGPWPAGALLTRSVGRMGERIAQYVLAWILAECQAVPEFVAQQERAEWRRIPSELAAGQSAVVYGTGRIGTAVAGLLHGCGIGTTGVARTATEPRPPFGTVVATDDRAERTALAGARWVVSTLPLTATTEGFFGPERFAAMSGATFLNVGRGGTVDLPALDGALRAGTVRGSVLDVLPHEPAAPDADCWRLPRTVVTSHSAGITADDDVLTDFTACWDALRAGRTPELAVDVARGY